MDQGGQKRDPVLEIARQFHTLTVVGIPRFDASRRDEARRFINLIDVLYEHNVNLICSADAVPDQLCDPAADLAAFARTASPPHRDAIGRVPGGPSPRLRPQLLDRPRPRIVERRQSRPPRRQIFVECRHGRWLRFVAGGDAFTRDHRHILRRRLLARLQEAGEPAEVVLSRWRAPAFAQAAVIAQGGFEEAANPGR